MNSNKGMNAPDGNHPAAYLSRKRLNHRGPLSIDVTSVWYFITICAKDHAPWSMCDDRVGRDDPIAPHDQGAAFAVGRDEKRPHSIAVACDSVAVGRDDPIAPTNPYNAIMSTGCHFQNIGKWNLALLLVMPDHLHLIANIPPGAMGSSRPTGLERVIRDFKRSVSRLFGIRFQRDFFDTRLRDDAHFAEKYNYILGNPVRKGLCATQEEWPYSIAFSREGVPVGRDDPIAPWSMRDDRVGRDDPIAPYGQGVTFAVGRDDPIAPDELKKVLPSKAQLAKCVADAERQIGKGRTK